MAEVVDLPAVEVRAASGDCGGPSLRSRYSTAGAANRSGASTGTSIGSAAALASTSRRLRNAASFTAADRRAATADTALNSSLRSAASTRSRL
jgi:hypothetical protein